MKKCCVLRLTLVLPVVADVSIELAEQAGSDPDGAVDWTDLARLASRPLDAGCIRLIIDFLSGKI